MNQKVSKAIFKQTSWVRKPLREIDLRPSNERPSYKRPELVKFSPAFRIAPLNLSLPTYFLDHPHRSCEESPGLLEDGKARDD
ncbi:hypothetical protein ES707_14875 [subsurface metagenome]